MKLPPVTKTPIALIAAVGAAILIFGAGWWLASPADAPSDAADEASGTLWTCAMHPQIQQPKPGLCPICEMDLIPLEAAAAGGLREVSIMPEAAALLDIRVAPVVRAPATAELRLFGRIAYDERRLAETTARVSGRLDQLHIDFTGALVQKGDPLAEIYSPELYVAQEALINSTRRLASAPAAARDTLRRLVEAAREKLRLLDISDAQIDKIAQQSEPGDHITLTAPQDGIVVERHAVEGAYVETGDPLFTIAELSDVWLNLEAYESDDQWLQPGQHVTFTVEALPGRVFHGQIAFIDPQLDQTRRVMKVRVDVPNPDGALKPGMFARATVQSTLGVDGMILEDEVESDSDRLPLLVPASAVLATGKRAIVYVRLPEREEPTFEGREVVLGPKVGDRYIIDEGLSEGELVVTRGAFTLDSELQLTARPSMMNPNAGIEERSAAEAPPELVSQWSPVRRALGRLLTAARGGQDAEVDAALARLRNEIQAIDAAAFSESLASRWREFSSRIINALEVADEEPDPAAQLRLVVRAVEEAARFLGLDAAPIVTEAAADPAWSAALREALDPYYAVAAELSADDAAGAKQAAAAVVDAAAKLPDSEPAGAIREAAAALAAADSLEEIRAAFHPLSDFLIDAIPSHAPDAVGDAFVLQCPMAFGAGEEAEWISPSPEVANPYIGERMLKCGSVLDVLSRE